MIPMAGMGDPMKPAPDRRRCGAVTRGGAPCRSFAVFPKGRCRMHGGAPGSGAPKGNRNAQTHGLHTKAAKADRRALNRLMADFERLLDDME
jgi:glucans biosynthesis protein